MGASNRGFDGEDREFRTILFVCYHIWESLMLRDISRKQLRDQIARRIEILTHK